MMELLGSIGAETAWLGDDDVADRRAGAADPRGALRARRAACGPRSTCSGRCWLGTARRASRCPAATTSGAASSTCTSMRSPAMGAELEVVHGFIDARCNALVRRSQSCSSSRASARPRPCSRQPCSPRARPSSRTRHASPRSATWRRFLAKMGAQIEGAGTSTIEIEGVDELSPVEHAIIGDRIEAGTLLFAAVATGGDVTVEGIDVEHARDRRRASSRRWGRRSVRLPTGCAPGATNRSSRSTCRRCRSRDSPPTSCRSRSRRSRRPTAPRIVTENIFDNRFAFVDELHRMGADVRTEGRHAVVRGVDSPLRGARCGPTTSAPGPRSCSPASPPTARPWSSIRTTSSAGYPDLAGKLRALGADVERVEA